MGKVDDGPGTGLIMLPHKKDIFFYFIEEETDVRDLPNATHL